MNGRRKPVPSFVGLKPASPASARAKRMNRSSEARHERLLRSLLWRRGFRFRKNVKAIAGKPDLVFRREWVAVFCDGDFWHGRGWRRLSSKLRSGANASYWVEKIRANILRDRRTNLVLRRGGWQVVRLWETDILSDPEGCAATLEAVLHRRRAERRV